MTGHARRVKMLAGWWGLALTAAVISRGADEAGVPVIDRLLDGVTRVAAPGPVGGFSVFGPQAEPLLAGRDGETGQLAIAAVAAAGRGRLVALGHDGYLAADILGKADTGRLAENCLRWLAGPGSAGRPVRVGLDGRKDFADWLTAREFQVVPADADPPAYDVLVFVPGAQSEDEVARVLAFVNRGGGVLAAATGRAREGRRRSGGPLDAAYPGNRLTQPMGIAWLGRAADAGDGGVFEAGAPHPMLHARRALAAAVRQREDRKAISEAYATLAAHTLQFLPEAFPEEDRLLRPHLDKVLAERGAELFAARRERVSRSEVLDRFLAGWIAREAGGAPPEELKAHPSAAVFPGAVPDDAPRVVRTVRVHTAVPGWHSTGLYAPPGQRIDVEIPEAAVALNMAVRIGAHRDRLWHLDEWKRFPDLTRSFALDRPAIVAASAFGGPLYIDVPGGLSGDAFEIRVIGGVEAPHYVLGRTTAEAWKQIERDKPAPWAELETAKIILTVPSSVVRELDDPESLMKTWDRVLDACADLAGRPRERSRPERIVPDVQISAGYMHSGYPIMTWDDQYRILVDEQKLLQGQWGLYHELGHNHQSRDWTFDGAGEVTVNLFTLYVYDTVCGRPPARARDVLAPDRRARTIERHAANGRPFDQWKRDPFLALIMYVQLQEAFGWEAYRKVFAEYRDLPSGERPRSDQAKRDQWMVRFSKTVGRNLGPFFVSWGVPVSEEALAEIAQLPAWMPATAPDTAGAAPDGGAGGNPEG